jgi:hypothetical protein
MKSGEEIASLHLSKPHLPVNTAVLGVQGVLGEGQRGPKKRWSVPIEIRCSIQLSYERVPVRIAETAAQFYG